MEMQGRVSETLQAAAHGSTFKATANFELIAHGLDSPEQLTQELAVRFMRALEWYAGDTEGQVRSLVKAHTHGDSFE